MQRSRPPPASSDDVEHQFYEALVGGVSKMLENPRDAVATQIDISGSTNSPNVSTWQAIWNLVRNAVQASAARVTKGARKRADSAPAC